LGRRDPHPRPRLDTGAALTYTNDIVQNSLAGNPGLLGHDRATGVGFAPQYFRLKHYTCAFTSTPTATETSRRPRPRL
jgi:hypothetical protein